MATHSSIFAWRIPWTEEPVGLQSMSLRRVGHDWGTNTHIQCLRLIVHFMGIVSLDLGTGPCSTKPCWLQGTANTEIWIPPDPGWQSRKLGEASVLSLESCSLQAWVAYLQASFEGKEKASMIFKSLHLGEFSVIWRCYTSLILCNTKTKEQATHLRW